MLPPAVSLNVSQGRSFVGGQFIWESMWKTGPVFIGEDGRAPRNGRNTHRVSMAQTHEGWRSMSDAGECEQQFVEGRNRTVL